LRKRFLSYWVETFDRLRLNRSLTVELDSVLTTTVLIIIKGLLSNEKTGFYKKIYSMS
jgi:hypothetical protein